MLNKVESRVFSEGCVRVLVCLPSPRTSAIKWIQHRGYHNVGSISYPFKGLQHQAEDAVQDIRLVRFVIINPEHSLGVAEANAAAIVSKEAKEDINMDNLGVD